MRTSVATRVGHRLDLAHVAWLFSFFSLFSGLLKAGEGIEAIDAGNFLRIVFLTISGVLSSWCIVSRNEGILTLFHGPQKWLLLYAIIAVLSGAYASHGYYSIWKSIEIVADVILIGAVLSSIDAVGSAQKLYQICIRVFAVLLGTVWIGAVIAPDKAFIHSRGLLPIQLQGLWPPVNPNGLAFMSAFLLIAFVCRMRDCSLLAKILSGAFATLAGATLVLAQSRTSLIGCAVALVAYGAIGRNKAVLYFSLISIAVLVLWGAGRQILLDYLMRGQSAELATSLSGRTIAWNAAMKSFSRSPIIGNGFASAGRFDVLGGGAMSTLHGSAFDVLVGVGILGFIPWLIGVVSTVWRLGVTALRRRSPVREMSAGSAEIFAVMVLLVVRATTSSGLALHEQSFLLFVILVAHSWAWWTENGNRIKPSLVNA